jgi:TolA-binding protein
VPQPQSGGSKPRSNAKTTGRAAPKRSTAGSSARATRASRSGAAQGRGSGSSSSGRSTKARASASPEARLEAAAERLRKLNERIIEAGKQAGETTLSSYEKALKAIASTVERGPGSSEIDWISHLATTQAKFIRDVTEAWTSAARGMLKK